MGDFIYSECDFFICVKCGRLHYVWIIDRRASMEQ